MNRLTTTDNECVELTHKMIDLATDAAGKAFFLSANNEDVGYVRREFLGIRDDLVELAKILEDMKDVDPSMKRIIAGWD